MVHSYLLFIASLTVGIAFVLAAPTHKVAGESECPPLNRPQALGNNSTVATAPRRVPGWIEEIKQSADYMNHVGCKVKIDAVIQSWENDPYNSVYIDEIFHFWGVFVKQSKGLAATSATARAKSEIENGPVASSGRLAAIIAATGQPGNNEQTDSSRGALRGVFLYFMFADVLMNYFTAEHHHARSYSDLD
ncbi:hypothetical protein J3R30DRAFT_30911 [Lentinula aciculospora]|uniref:Uncharacterized protein n=1 Tax=Lentinula aciculospora TaxID=153920 RepID=A0A9W9ATR1_9AGAR|nr:hypothetical protein J3R30DRAFT_30911 [Lentinula aciculospora]